MDKVVAIIQARMSSNRLPRKAALDVYGKPLLERVVDQVRKAKLVDTIVVATSEEQDDRVIELMCERLNVACFRGSLTDVRSRFVEIGKRQQASIIVRVTADNPLTEPHYIDTLVAAIVADGTIDYCVMERDKIPDGALAEVFRFNSFLESINRDDSAFSREHVTPGLKSMGRVRAVEPTDEYTLRDYFVGVDTFQDYLKINEIFSRYSGCTDILKSLIADVRNERRGIQANRAQPNDH